MVVLFFGDSITQGAWDEEGGWVNRLLCYINKKVIHSKNGYYRLAFNLGISGDTSTDLLLRLENELIARQDSDMAIIFSIGINDTIYLQNKQSNLTSLEQFKDNIIQLIKISHKYTQSIYFISLTPVEDEKLNPLPWDNNKSYSLKTVEKFNDVLFQLCLDKGVRFIDIFSLLAKTDRKNILIDCLHPNSIGHELMYKFIKENLVKENII